MKSAHYGKTLALLLLSAFVDWFYIEATAEARRTFQFDLVIGLRLLIFVAFYLLVLTWVADIWKQGFARSFGFFLLALGVVALYIGGVPAKPFGGQWLRSLVTLTSPLLALTAHCGALFIAVALRGLLAGRRS